MFDIQIVLMHFTVCPVNKCHMLCCTRLHCFVNITGVFFCIGFALKDCSLFIDQTIKNSLNTVKRADVKNILSLGFSFD